MIFLTDLLSAIILKPKKWANFIQLYEEVRDDNTKIAIHAGTISVDTFFCIGGLLTAYLGTAAWEKAVKSGFFGTLKTYCLFIIHRYARLTPVMALGIWSAVSFWPIFGNGGICEPATWNANVSSD